MPQVGNASESAAVLRISPRTTPYQLKLLKTGRSVSQTNAAMARGTHLELAARAAYKHKPGLSCSHSCCRMDRPRPVLTACHLTAA